MSKMSDMAATIEELHNAAVTITDVANWLTEMFSTTVDEVSDAAALAKPQDKSRMGFTAEIRSLLQKYGAAKLSGIDPIHYETLVAEAKVLGDGN